MNPVDFLFLLASFLLAAAIIGRSGLTINGIGPAFLMVFGGVFHFWMQWIRHKSWIQNQGKLGAPSTHHFGLIGALVMLVTFLVALVWVLVTMKVEI